MKGKNLIFLLMLAFASSAFTQVSEVADTIILFDTQCDCFKAEYDFKKELLDGNGIPLEEGKTVINPEFLRKHNISKWETLETINTRCFELPFSGIEPETCIYEQKVAELAADFELIRRVIQMQTRPCIEIDSNEK